MLCDTGTSVENTVEEAIGFTTTTIPAVVISDENQ